MSMLNEKRSGQDRRVRYNALPEGFIERRQVVERRATAVAEISFSEWAASYVEYQGRARSNADTRMTAPVPEAPDRPRN